MEAIEFVSHIHNGVIRIPKKYQDRMFHQARVIILTDKIETPMRKKKFKAVRLTTKGFRFDRDSANER